MSALEWMLTQELPRAEGWMSAEEGMSARWWMLAERWMSVEESKSVELTLLRALTRVSQSKLPERIERRRIETQAIEFEA
jgi:hypothetical protein